MDSGVEIQTVDKNNLIPDASDRGKKNKGKVSKRVHKSERERKKREHLNDLFLDLANVLKVTDENNGQASILSEATRLLKDMLAQVERLKKENVSLLTEFKYVNMEKKELDDENSLMQAQIKKLLMEIEDRLGVSHAELQAPEIIASHFCDNQAPMVGPVYVIPLAPSSYGNCDASLKYPTSNVSKPHARYPNPCDSWPSQLLGEKPNANE